MGILPVAAVKIIRDSRFPRCAFRRRIKFATGRTAPDSRLPRCAFRRRIKFATGRTAPDSRFPTPHP
ncbi:MAG: hypothetical protein F6K55_01570 [Moorea sp. SIO4A3]|nr:hypothetical protein [Moorena sp. SIO4A3]